MLLYLKKRPIFKINLELTRTQLFIGKNIEDGLFKLVCGRKILSRKLKKKSKRKYISSLIYNIGLSINNESTKHSTFIDEYFPSKSRDIYYK